MKTPDPYEALGAVIAVGLGVAILAVVALPLIALYAWVLCTLWGWFLLPLGAPPLGLAQAYGLCCIVRLLACQPDELRDDLRKPLKERALVALLWPLVALAAGWVAALLSGAA